MKGRPKLPETERTQIYSVCLKPSEAKAIRAKYKDISKAVRVCVLPSVELNTEEK